MSGRRSKKSKYYSRSYSKPLFDPQRLLYFSTTNQRIGKVIRPKSSAVNNTSVITKEQEEQILEDLNETKSFRLQREGKLGFPICRFKIGEVLNSIDIQGKIEEHHGNWVLSFPFTNFINEEFKKTDKFVKNFQPFTPSICSPTKVSNTCFFGLGTKRPGDVLHYCLFLLNGADIEPMLLLPDNDALTALMPYCFYHFQVPFNDVNKTKLELGTDSSYFTFYQTPGPGGAAINKYMFYIPSGDYHLETSDTMKFPAGPVVIAETDLSPELATRFVQYINQLNESYELTRISIPLTDHRHYMISESLDPNPTFDTSQGSLHYYICCSVYLVRTDPANTEIPFTHDFEMEGIEINPYLNEQ